MSAGEGRRADLALLRVDRTQALDDLEVTTARRGGEVEIRIINTVGAPACIPGHGLALRNVRQRLKLMHDVAGRFELDATPTRFALRILLPL